MKTKIEIDIEATHFKYKVYRKQSGFLAYWTHDKDFKSLEEAQSHAHELSKHPHPIAVYKNGKKIK